MLEFDLKNYNLFGKIKSVDNKTFYTNNNNEIAREKFAVLSWKFNEFGFITHSKSVEYSGLIYSNYIFEYNEKNQCIERQFIYKDKISSRDIFKYDINGRVIEKAYVREPDYVVSREEMIYDTANNTETIIFYSSSGKIIKKEISHYNIKRELKLFEVVENNKVTSSYNYFYPDELTKSVFHFEANKILSKKSKVIYDKYGNLVEEFEFSTDNKETRYRFQQNKYNEANQLIEELSGNRIEPIHWKRVYKYDVFGNKIVEEKYLPNKKKLPEIELFLDSVIETEIEYY